MPTIHLTDATVRSLKSSDRYVTYWCTKTPGFGLRVGKRSRTWTVMRGRDRERISFATYPDLPLADARTEAKRLLSAEAEPKHVTRTFEAAGIEFIDEHYRGKSARTKAEAKRLLEKHFRHLTKMVLPEIEDTDIRECLDELAETPSEQLHAFRVVRCFFRWAVKPPRRYLKHSPMEGYDPPARDRKGTRILLDDELKAVWKAAERPQEAIVRLMVLWGTRNTETAVLEHSWAISGVITIPGAVTKNGRDHGIPICSLAEKVLGTVPGTVRYLFPGRGGESLSARAVANIFDLVKTRSGTSAWTPRDLRRTFRSNMARLGVPREVCEVLINHAPPVLDEIYDRYDRLTEKREALEKYEAFMQALVAG